MLLFIILDIIINTVIIRIIVIITKNIFFWSKTKKCVSSIFIKNLFHICIFLLYPININNNIIFNKKKVIGVFSNILILLKYNNKTKIPELYEIKNQYPNQLVSVIFKKREKNNILFKIINNVNIWFEKIKKKDEKIIIGNI